MWTTAVAISTCLLLVAAGNKPTYEHSNGWSPVSTALVYDQMERERNPPPPYATGNIQLLHTDINNILLEKELNPEEINVVDVGIGCAFDGSNCNEIKHDGKTGPAPIYDFVPSVVHLTTNQNDTDKAVRRAKKIADNYPLTLFSPENLQKSNTYEVTEDTLDLEESIANNGYNYEPPKKDNKTVGLFEILSKYKINKDDDLPNYALSRIHKSHISSKEITGTNQRNLNFQSSNNLNHLPVDRVLAVILSNYGLYLRGMYGSRNGYSNLYGYLASNNIHNNKPFGFYKIYSDTDSSN